jgi:hypothetical protein
MRPDNTPIPTPDPRGQVTPPARDHTAQHEAAADITREQIDQIYQQQPGGDQASVYQRTHTKNQHSIAPEWQRYHSSWQQYYQQYYERYYVSEAQRAHDTYKKHVDALATQQAPADETVSEDEALYDLRSQLVGKVRESAKNVRKSRHFVPLLSGAIGAANIWLYSVQLSFSRVCKSLRKSRQYRPPRYYC